MSNLPALYKGQTKAWMSFVIGSQSSLKLKLVPCCSLLERTQGLCYFLDNCSARPPSEELCSGRVFVQFLPPNVTSLIQPLHQRVLESIKRPYKKEALVQPFAERRRGRICGHISEGCRYENRR